MCPSSSVKESLLARAWLLHSFFSVTRLFLICFEQTAWQRGLKTSLASRDAGADTLHNTEYIYEIEPIVRYGLISLALLGLILDLTCLKWLRVAHALLYLELCYGILSAMVPFENSGQRAAWQTPIALSLMSSLSFSCDPLPNLLFLAVFLLQLAFLQLPFV